MRGLLFAGGQHVSSTIPTPCMLDLRYVACSHRSMGRWIQFTLMLLCLSIATSLSGCAVEVTEWRLKAQSQAKYTYVCRRTPDVPEGVQYWAVNTATGETVTDREPERLLEFAQVADWIYEYHPHAPASTVDHLAFPYNHLTCDSDMWVTVPPRKSLPKNEIDVPYAFRQAMAEVLADGCALPPPETASMQGVREHMGQLLTTPRPIVIDPETGKPRDFISPLQKTILRELSIRVLFEGGAVREKDLPKDADGKPYKWWRDPKIIAQPNVQRVGGFVSGVAVGALPGGAMGSDVLVETRMLPQGSRDARIGKALGEIVVGGGQFFVGIGGVAAGTGMSATGGGAAPGALICLGSITLVANGGATFCHGAEQLTLELLFKRDDTQATVIPIAPPPPKPVAPKPPPPKPKPLPIAKPAPKPTPTKTTTTTRVRGAREPTMTTTTSPSGTRTTTRVKGKPPGDGQVPAVKREARLPPKGTPERRAIETARSKGIEAKQAQELANIRAGGRGSGVWTEKELAEIRLTGKFPIDARWHHDPTVANRPDLAADPSVVRPVRGGTKGHLEAHGGDFRKP